MEWICDNLSAAENGHLLFAGQDVPALAREYGTPLYLMDEDRIRHNCRLYQEAFRAAFGEKYRLVYASKAASFGQMYPILEEEGFGADVVSPGEICTARRAGFDMSRTIFHGNNKTDADIAYALEAGVGCFVVDNREELLALEAEAARRGITQRIQLRVTPGIDPHTYEAVNTGRVDSKFGSAIETGQADSMVREALAQPHLVLEGLHCHVGSQVFTEDVFERTAAVMLDYMAHIRKKFGYTAAVLNLGGGYGVRYVMSDPTLDIAAKVAEVAATIRVCCQRLSLPAPILMMEPGRSIVADAGLTVYSVGAVKEIPQYKNYVSIDGGMTDNPRYALYGAAYTCLAAERVTEPCTYRCSLVGRCCESGDVIQEDILLPPGMRRGELVTVCTTGAYHYSMASNYNRYPRPPIVMLRQGTARLAVRRETVEDVAQYDL